MSPRIPRRPRKGEHWLHRWKRHLPWRRTPVTQSAALLTQGGRHVPYPSWSLPDGVDLVDDPAPARWVEESLARHPWATVGAILPDHFEAYARVLHPAYRRVGASEHEPVSWAEVAAMTGKTMHARAEFAKLAGIEPWNGRPSWGERPDVGDLPLEVSEPLVGLLRRFTSAPDRCWFCIWNGWGDLFALEGYEEDAYPHVKTPGREYLLAVGGIDMATRIGEDGRNDPSIWWPDDRAWCVATEIDLDTTYVGGTRACITALSQDPRLEVWPAGVTDRIDFDSDTLND